MPRQFGTMAAAEDRIPRAPPYARDPADLDAILSQYAPRIYRMARAICGNERDAEEVTQEVCLTVLSGSTGLAGQAGLWMCVVCATTSAALARRRGARAESASSLEPYLPAFKSDGHRDGDAAFLLADWSGVPEEGPLAAEARRLAAEALDRLPDAYRVVVLLRDGEGLSHAEVAEAVGESVALVKSRLHLARMAIREQLARQLNSKSGGNPAAAGGTPVRGQPPSRSGASAPPAGQPARRPAATNPK
jgi:RNA polymerase sigma-70 factor (ECF subfamily)